MKRILATLTLLVCFGIAQAQGTFDFSLVGGANFCQIDGDNSGSYNKLGYFGGVNTSFSLGGHFRMLVELGVSNKGSVVENLNREISLLYVQVPVMLCWSMGRLRLGAGLAPGVLAQVRVDEGGVELPEAEALYKKVDRLPFCANINLRLTKHWGIDARYTNSFLSVHEGKKGAYRFSRDNSGAFNRLISAGVSYTF
ncbi:MAG: PorT family protein [Bacteroidales bacterium]|nr:PorT family protein [Bacteroidales bacterium]